MVKDPDGPGKITRRQLFGKLRPAGLNAWRDALQENDPQRSATARQVAKDQQRAVLLALDKGLRAIAVQEYAEAADRLRDYAKAKPKDLDARLLLGRVLLEMQHHVQARVECERALRDARFGEWKNAPLCRLCMSLAMLAGGKFEKAAAALSEFDDAERPEVTAALRALAPHAAAPQAAADTAGRLAERLADYPTMIEMGRAVAARAQAEADA